MSSKIAEPDANKRLEFAYFFPKVRKVTSKHPFLCANVYLVAISIILELHVFSDFNILKMPKKIKQRQ